eukprot:734297-Pleurochrysis_carterae.AAC.22
MPRPCMGKLEAELQRAEDGSILARVREEQALYAQAEAASSILQEQSVLVQQQLLTRSTKLSKEEQKVIYLRSRGKELAGKVGDYYQVKSKRKFIEKPTAKKNAELNLAAACLTKSPRLRASWSRTTFKYFHDNGIHPCQRLGHCRGHYNSKRHTQPGSGPLLDLFAVLAHQAAHPPPQSAAQDGRQ